MSWRVEFQMFRCDRQDCNEALDDATSFAAQLKAELLIGISHALEQEHIVVAVWFWSQGAYWTCPRCGEQIEEQFDSCWSCSTPKPQVASSNPSPEAPDEARLGADQRLFIQCHKIQGAWLEWEDFFGEVAKLAGAIGPERLVGIAHSGAKENALATVFYRSEED